MLRSASGLPFDDIRNLVAQMPGPDEAARAAAAARQGQLVKPPGALGRLEDIAIFIAGWQGREIPQVNRPTVAVFAATHGVASRGVSPYPPEVTKQMVATFTDGKAAVNQICGVFGAGLRVFDLALDMPTPDIVERDAPDRGRMRRHHGLRHGGAGRRAGPALPRRDGHRQHHRRRRDLPRPLWRRGRRLGRTGHRRHRRGARPQDRGGAGRGGAFEERIWTTRWKCCASSAGARWRRWPAPSSPRGSSACRWCWTAMS